MHQVEAAQHALAGVLQPLRQIRFGDAGKGEAFERHRAFVHDFVGDAEQMHAVGVHEAVDIDLAPGQQLLDHHVVRADAELRVALQRLVMRLDQPLYDVLLPGLEAQMLDQFFGVVTAARQHRKRGLHRFDEHRIAQRTRGLERDGVRDKFEFRAQVGRHVAQAQARFVFVLRSQNRFGRGARQPQALCDQRGGQRAELLVRAEHSVDAATIALDHAVDKAPDVEPHQARIAREAEQVEAMFMKTVAPAALIARQVEIVPIGTEQHQHAGRVESLNGGCDGEWRAAGHRAVHKLRRRVDASVDAHRCRYVKFRGLDASAQFRLTGASRTPSSESRCRCRPGSGGYSFLLRRSSGTARPAPCL